MRLLYVSTALTFRDPYIVLTLRLYVLYESRNKQRLLPYTLFTDWFCVPEVESVYCVVRAESLYKTDTFRLQKVNDAVSGSKYIYGVH